METKRNKKQSVFCINQIKYLKEIIKCFCIEDYKAIGMPLDLKMREKNEMIEKPEIFDVCHVVHTTRFDILNMCDESTHDQWPIANVKHWMVVRCIFYHQSFN